MTKKVKRNPNVKCDNCENTMYRRPSTLKTNTGKFCSRKCRNHVHRNTGKRGPNLKLAGENNPAWKGGVTFKRAKGNYIGPKYVRCPIDFILIF